MGNTEGTSEPEDSVETNTRGTVNSEQLQRDYDAAGSVGRLAKLYGVSGHTMRQMLDEYNVPVKKRGISPEKARETWQRPGRRELRSQQTQQQWQDPDQPLYHWDRPGQRERQRDAWLTRIETARENGSQTGVPAAEAELREALKRASLSFTAPAIVLDGQYIVDVLLEDYQIVIEADGVSHKMQGAEEHDRDREQHIRAAGFTVIRFSYRQIADDSDGCIASLNLSPEVNPVYVEKTHGQVFGELGRMRKRHS